MLMNPSSAIPSEDKHVLCDDELVLSACVAETLAEAQAFLVKVDPDSSREEGSETKKPFCFEVHKFLILMIPSYE